jgi:hypothetical protein
MTFLIVLQGRVSSGIGKTTRRPAKGADGGRNLWSERR